VSEIVWVEKGLSPTDRLKLIEIAHESKDERIREHSIRLLDQAVMVNRTFANNHWPDKCEGK
jgi:hypothetical protein